VLSSTANGAVKAARKLARSARARAGGSFVVEGPKAVAAAGTALDRLFVTPRGLREAPEVVEQVRGAGADIIEVTDAVLASVATTVTPQGLVGVATLEPPTLGPALRAADLVVVLVEVSDPGNLGTIVRTAHAAGAAAVVCTERSADARNPKAVRASAGSLFALPVVEHVAAGEAIDACRTQGLQVLGATARGANDHDQLDLAPPTAFVFGSEAHGLPEQVLARCDDTVRVPLAPGAESLNLAAAAAVLCFEAARQRRHTKCGHTKCRHTKCRRAM
jgi:RNA methyltransferase, TrmH family